MQNEIQHIQAHAGTWEEPEKPESDAKMAKLKQIQAEPMKRKLLQLVDDVLQHDGFGEIRVEVKILKRQQKEVILHCGKQYRFVVDRTQG
jgi:hypothetical protein